MGNFPELCHPHGKRFFQVGVGHILWHPLGMFAWIDEVFAWVGILMDWYLYGLGFLWIDGILSQPCSCSSLSQERCCGRAEIPQGALGAMFAPQRIISG